MQEELLDKEELQQFLKAVIPKLIQAEKDNPELQIIDVDYYFKAFNTIINILNTKSNDINALKIAFGLIQNFHTALTGEKLHYLITSGSSSSNLAEKYCSWDELIPAISIQDSELHYNFTLIISSINKQTVNAISSLTAWKNILPFFENTPGAYYKRKARPEQYISKSGNPHLVYAHKGKDTYMRVFYSTYTSQNGTEVKLTRYTYEDPKNHPTTTPYHKAFNAGHLKEWFDKKYLNVNEEDRKTWLNKLCSNRHPIREILSNFDQDKGSLTGDFRIDKQTIIQDKLNNTKIASITQIINACKKIQELLTEFRKEQSDKNAKELIKLFLESDIAKKLAADIIKDTKLRLPIK